MNQKCHKENKITCSRCLLFSGRHCWMRITKLLISCTHFSRVIALILSVIATFDVFIMWELLWCLWETSKRKNLGFQVRHIPADEMLLKLITEPCYGNISIWSQSIILLKPLFLLIKILMHFELFSELLKHWNVMLLCHCITPIMLKNSGLMVPCFAMVTHAITFFERRRHPTT